jgi:hypothetical protein
VLSVAEAARAVLAKLPRLHVERVRHLAIDGEALVAARGYVQKSVAGSF